MTSKLGFSAEYVERISPAERRLYIQYYIQEKEEEQKRKSSKSSGPSIGSVGV